MNWDRDCQRVERLLSLRGISLDSVEWREMREFWDEKLEEWFRYVRAGIQDPDPLTRFERLALLLSGLSAEVPDAFLELADRVDAPNKLRTTTVGVVEGVDLVYASLAALVFQDQIQRTFRRCDMNPPSEADRLLSAIERGSVLMDSPAIFVDGGSLLAGYAALVVFEDVDALLDLAEDAWS